MKAVDLIESFMKQATFGTDNYRGHKWLTVKQVNFLYSLAVKEDRCVSGYFDSKVWFISPYKVTLSRIAPNGCRQIRFEKLEGDLLKAYINTSK